MISENARIRQIRTFTGDGFPFAFPEFAGWEVKTIQHKTPDLSIVFINWPDTICFETAPQTVVRKVPGLASPAGHASRNPNGVMHAGVYDPSLYVPGHTPGPGWWDHLEFYGPSFGVRITPFRHDGDEYSPDLFTRTVTDSFRFVP